MKLIITLLVNALIVMLVAYLVPGIVVSSFGTAVVVALVLGLINITMRPILLILTFPVNILSLGLFTFIVNALMFALAAWLVPGFVVAGFLPALVGSLLLSLIHIVTNHLNPVR